MTAAIESVLLVIALILVSAICAFAYRICAFAYRVLRDTFKATHEFEKYRTKLDQVFTAGWIHDYYYHIYPNVTSIRKPGELAKLLEVNGSIS